jgi:hypothetical protein
MTRDIERRLERLEAWLPRVVKEEDLQGERALEAVLADYGFDPPTVAADEMFEAIVQVLDRAAQDKRNGLYEPAL